jgi:hypothetical protein
MWYVPFVSFLMCIMTTRILSARSEDLDENFEFDSSRRSGSRNRDQDRSSIHAQPSDSNSTSSNKKKAASYFEEDELSEEYKRELRAKQTEARRQKLMKERRKQGALTAKRIIQESENDSCDWRQRPFAMFRGELCGSHYKVLGLSRKNDVIDKPTIKKAYRQASLSVHPDKNPAEDAQTAFKIVQDAYECLQDESCKESYDQQLAIKEETILWQRHELKHLFMEKVMNIANQVHYGVSVGAHYVYKMGLDLWNWAGEWELTLFNEDWPFGRPLLVLALLWKGHFLITIHFLAYIIESINFEIAKRRGLL